LYSIDEDDDEEDGDDYEAMVVVVRGDGRWLECGVDRSEGQIENVQHSSSSSSSSFSSALRF